MSKRYPVLCMGCGRRVGWSPTPGSTGVCKSCAKAMGVNLEKERRIIDKQLEEQNEQETR